MGYELDMREFESVYDILKGFGEEESEENE